MLYFLYFLIILNKKEGFIHAFLAILSTFIYFSSYALFEKIKRFLFCISLSYLYLCTRKKHQTNL